MPLDGWQGLQRMESDCSTWTRTEHARELDIIARLLDAYLAGLEDLGHFTISEDNELQLAWLLLAARGFNSMRCAQTLLQTGYYAQALALLRSAGEDWLVAKDCENHRPTLDALLHERGRLGRKDLTLAKMAERVGIGPVWISDYGSLSEFAHPRPLSLRASVEPNTNKLRLGPSYDEVLCLYCCEALLRGALLMMELVVRLLGSKGAEWDKLYGPVVCEAGAWLAELRSQYGDSDTPGDDRLG